MSEGVPQAFCPLLWRANGGEFGPNGTPIIRIGEYTRGNCSKPFDCGTCTYLQEELAYHAGKYVWVCPACVNDLLGGLKAAGVGFRLPGFYSEGELCGCPDCPRENRYSILCQLIIWA